MGLLHLIAFDKANPKHSPTPRGSRARLSNSSVKCFPLLLFRNVPVLEYASRRAMPTQPELK